MIRYGAMYSPNIMNPVKFAKRAEDSGFDSLWGHDHSIHGFDGLGLMGAFAGATSHIPVGCNVVVLPYRHPSVVATCLYTIAYATERKLILCAGVGGERLDEYALAKADLHTRGRYTNEALEVITKLWTERPASFHGRWSDFENVEIQYEAKVIPDIWVGGRSDAAIERAVKYGVAYNPYMVSPKQLSDRYDKLRNCAAQVGRDLDGFTFAVTTWYYPGRDIDDVVQQHGGSRMSEVEDRRLRSHNMLGNPDDCLSKLQEFIDAGAEHILIGCAPRYDAELYFKLFEEIDRAARKLTPGR